MFEPARTVRCMAVQYILVEALHSTRPSIRKKRGARKWSKKTKTYNIRDSPVVTHPSTSLTITSLSVGERTGSRVLWYLWSELHELGR
ncbi:hypothetical protein NKR19_g10142 [Coniochaeta hoffmannii]|uniref:Uncharacterized protein n=1 Tax=Coniochaeta hoffmannii TaxID=91930 RepID=A0AA38VIH5_9PEZI|nr:hypothetical protein NKR19_g10142 [Coniochaeta hoffmannii]